MQGAYADPQGIEAFFHKYWRSWLERLPAGVRSGLPAADKLHLALEAVAGGGGRDSERASGREVRRRLGLPESGSTPGGDYSLSHGGGLCLGVRWNGVCVGVDLESASRPVTDAVRLRIAAETVLSPGGMGLSGIQVWCLKEAAFKSCPWNAGTTLAQYWLESWDPDQRVARIGFPPHPEGQRTGEAWATVIESQGVEAAFAVGIVGMRS